MPAPRPKAPHYVFHVPRLALRVGAIAFGVGMLLFVLVWWSGRDKNFYTAPSVESSAPLAELEPLPEPLPAGDGASDMPDAGAPSQPRPRLVEDDTPEPAPQPSPVDERFTPAPGTDTSRLPAAGVASSPTDQPVPLSGRTPWPRYPPAALRRRESGTVLVRVEVDTSGRPAGVALEQRSGSRELDRAALEAVREWRFQPAQRDGQPVPGSLVIPIDFRLE
jgi:protein TonB